jgi:hypothetical protein
MRFVRFDFGILLIPLCIAGTRTLGSLVMQLDPGDQAFPYPLMALLAGFLLWQLIFIFLTRPVRTYVFAHELTHALWGWFMGARVSKFKVAKGQGSVTLSKTNFLITLAPYFFPLYTVLLILVYYALWIFIEVEQYHSTWLGLIGFTWGFHLSFTITTLMQRQSDIRAYGHLFSYTFIYLMNVLGICLWVVLVSRMTVVQMCKFLYTDTVAAGKLARNAILWISTLFGQ